MANVPLSKQPVTDLNQLTQQQRHDLRAAILSVRWAADLLCPSDGSEPPLELIAEQLRQAYTEIQPVIDLVLTQKRQTSE